MFDNVILVVAHPDDEAYGCGALITQCVARKIPLKICYCTATSWEGEFELSSEKRMEAKNKFFDFLAKDGAPIACKTFPYMANSNLPVDDVYRSIEEEVLSFLTDNTLIVSHAFTWDAEPDHAVVGQATAMLTDRISKWVTHWEFVSPIPTDKYPIIHMPFTTEIMAVKEHMMKIYEDSFPENQRKHSKQRVMADSFFAHKLRCDFPYVEIYHPRKIPFNLWAN